VRISLQPAFILHHRAYRETSVLLDVFTETYGRISLIARGVRTHRSKLRALLQPFIPLLISWQGKSELMMMIAAESSARSEQLQGDCLLSGFYLNELLVRVLQKQDPHPRLYAIYQDTLLELQGAKLQQKTLRLFEKKLLEELGYGLQLQHDFSTGEAIVAERFYQFYPEQGFKYSAFVLSGESMKFKGNSVLALAKEQFHDEESLRDAKRLMRLALTPILGSQLLHSRKLFFHKA
jgi:DNA repair protein RecO (recombination protein O)